MCVCVLLVTWRANGIVLYMYEGKVLMDIYIYFMCLVPIHIYLFHVFSIILSYIFFIVGMILICNYHSYVA